MSDSTLTLTARQTADFELLANDGFAPLKGFMGSEDWKSVVHEMRLSSGEIWPIPIVLGTDYECSVGDTIDLLANNGKPLGSITVSEIFERDLEAEAENVYKTTEEAHPGVAAVYKEGARCIAGEITSTGLPDHIDAVNPYLLTPAEAKAKFAENGWKRVVAFQTRNPIHRAHEYITKCALELVDGLFIHPIVGETKSDDIPADTRMACYEALIENYYPSGRVVLGVNPSAMRYAGPREAVFHAIVRRNYGCTHFIVGRDHAGVGSYYGTFDAHRIFDDIDFAELGIEPMFFDHAFYSKKTKEMATTKTAPGDESDRIALSGTKVREMLGNGEMPPPEFSRPEVAQILIDAYTK
jgi:sulfate adenylyltransferase